jgi:hypothetical protein
MTIPTERLRALKQTKRLLEELCDPGKTPRVPSIVRDRARTLLKHYPLDSEIDIIAERCPEYFEKPSSSDKLKVLK